MSDVVENLDNNATMVAGLVAAKDEIFALRGQSKKAAKNIEDKLTLVTTSLDQAGKLADSIQTLQTKVGEIQTATNTQKTEVDRLLGVIQTSETTFTELREKTQEIFDDLEEKQTDAKDKYDEIDGLHDQLLVDDKDEQGNVTGECTETRIDSLEAKIKGILSDVSKDRTAAQTELATLKEQLTKDFAELKKALAQDIHKLLPQAGAAGLSSAYFESKSVYGLVACKSDNKWDQFVHFIRGVSPTILNYALFIGPLGFMAYEYYNLFKDVATIDEGVVLFRILIAAPLAVISWFGWSSISLSRRLYEEYNHKQRVMQLYRSFKEEIDEDGTEEQREKLLSIMLKTVDDKPALVMKSYEMLQKKIDIPFLSKPEKKITQECEVE